MSDEKDDDQVVFISSEGVERRRDPDAVLVLEMLTEMLVELKRIRRAVEHDYSD